MVNFGEILDAWEKTPGGRQQVSVPKEDEGTPSARRVSPRRIKIDATLDLHGYRLEQALMEVERFIAEGRAAGHQKLLIVHGKGESSGAVLRSSVRAFLEQDMRVGAMDYADGANGGRGALWFLLRSENPEA